MPGLLSIAPTNQPANLQTRNSNDVDGDFQNVKVIHT